jgi:hypothetical protein
VVTLRPYRPGDAPALLALFRDTIRRVNSRDYSPAQIAAGTCSCGGPALARTSSGRPLGLLLALIHVRMVFAAQRKSFAN